MAVGESFSGELLRFEDDIYSVEEKGFIKDGTYIPTAKEAELGVAEIEAVLAKHAAFLSFLDKQEQPSEESPQEQQPAETKAPAVKSLGSLATQAGQTEPAKEPSHIKNTRSRARLTFRR
jgi:hypothetical protein